MTEEITTSTAGPSSGIADVKIETNYTAPVEQQSTDPVSPEVQTSEPIETNSVAQPVQEAPVEDKASIAAREAIKDRLRADDAERRLKELQPKTTVPTSEPDINDQKTWGDKYKASPNDYETFRSAYKDWAMEEGRRLERNSYTEAQNQQAQLAMRTEVARKEQESRAKHTDYDSIIGPIVPVITSIPILKDFIARNAMGTEVAYELGKNPQILEQLMRSNVWDAGEQLLSLAARLKAPRPIEITKAPEPITPVGTRETVRPRLADLAAKDVGAYIRAQNKQELARKRAN